MSVRILVLASVVSLVARHAHAMCGYPVEVSAGDKKW